MHLWANIGGNSSIGRKQNFQKLGHTPSILSRTREENFAETRIR
jgi:hypothetical protein